ncbi:MAG: hypothetical protein AB7E60_02920 [Sphingobium sp.]
MNAQASPRPVRDYSQRRDVRAEGFDPDTPIAGYYRFRMRSGGALCGVRIWHGAPLDPVTGEELDRSHRWQAQVNGDAISLERVWPKCAADPIPADEYRHLCTVQSWARDHAPDSPFADPRRKADPITSPILF